MITQFNNRFFKSGGSVAALLLACLLTACTQPTNDAGQIQGSSITLKPPAQLAQIRAINNSQLTCIVTIDGQAVAMTSNGANTEWSGTVVVPENKTLQLEMRWVYETLPVAIHTRTINALTSDTTLAISSSDYTTDAPELDFDLDGYSNLSEFTDDFDPRDINSPGAPDIDVVIPWVSPSEVPTIDGFYDTIWTTAGGFKDREGNDLFIDNLMIDLGAQFANDTSRFRWAAMHDGTYLYIIVFTERVTEQTPFGDSQVPFRDDNLNLFLDGDNSKLSSYDGVDDMHFFIPFLNLRSPAPPNDNLIPVPNSDGDLIFDEDGNIRVSGDAGPIFVKTADLKANNNTDTSIGSRFGLGDNSVAAPEDFLFANCLCREDENTYELRINLAQAGIVVDRAFGIELQIDDDNTGGNRNARYGWAHPARSGGQNTDETWRNPSLMGTAILD